MSKAISRQVVLDTETTGLKVADDHRIIEIGCVEIINRRKTGETFHQYINPERTIDIGAAKVHGITDELLLDKPKFSDIADDFFLFITGAELIIHNAEFDIGFLHHELKKINSEQPRIDDISAVLDTLKMARDKHPGQKNSLDALCQRYAIDNSKRTLHGALLDAEILADVYLAMTGGQVSLSLSLTARGSVTGSKVSNHDRAKGEISAKPLKVIKANDDELKRHHKTLASLDKISQGQCVWLKQ